MFKTILVTFIAYAKAQRVTNQFLHDAERTTTLETCFSSILSTGQYESVLVVYSNQHEASSFIYQLHHVNLTLSIVLLNMKEDLEQVKNNNWHYEIIVILAEDDRVVEHIFNKLYLTPIWDPRGRFLVIYHREQSMNNVFHLAFKRYVLNVNVLRNNDTNIYTYFPYGNGHCGEDIQPVVLGHCYHAQDLYPTKVPTVLNGCRVRIITGYDLPAVLNVHSTSDNPKQLGYEVMIVRNILKQMNLTNDIQMLNISGYSYKLSNNSYSYQSRLYYLHENLYDLAFGAMFYNETFIDDFDATRIYRLDILKWHVPTAELDAQWKSIVLIFQKTLWYTVFGMLILNAIIWWLFSKVTSETMSFTNCVFGVLILLLNGGIQLPKTSVMRYLVVSWTLLALLLITTYQSQLLSILMKPVYEKQVATMEDILASDLHVLMLKQHFTAMSSSQIPVQMQLARKAQTVPYVTYSYHRMNYTKDIAFIGSEITTRYLMSSIYLDGNGRKKIYIFKQIHNNIKHCMYFRRGYPFFEQFDKQLSYILYGGLLNKWISDITYEQPDIFEDSQRVPITANQLGCAFLFLGIGYLISLLVLLTEILVFKMLKMKQRAPSVGE